MESSVVAYIALGANLGDRLGHLRAAAARIAATPGVTLVGRSSLYETSPVGGPSGQGDYLNAVLAVRTALDAEALLRRCLAIEEELGRRRTVANAARCVDLDVLLFDDQVIATDALRTPHPRMHLRRFVLAPLAEIAPDVVHPVLHTTVRALLEALPSDGERVERIQTDQWGPAGGDS